MASGRTSSFHNYADYALSDAFAEGLDQLSRFADERATAIMCSEAVWWRCHRRIIADYLLMRGRPVLHLMGKDRVEPASMTPPRGGGTAIWSIPPPLRPRPDQPRSPTPAFGRHGGGGGGGAVCSACACARCICIIGIAPEAAVLNAGTSPLAA